MMEKETQNWVETSVRYFYSPLVALCPSWDREGTIYLCHRRDAEGAGFPEVCIAELYPEGWIESDGEITAEMLPALLKGLSMLRAAGLIIPPETAPEPKQPAAYEWVCRLAGVTA